MTFSEKLFKLRKQKGLSQEALAEQLNTTRQAISKWENGQGFPETEKLLMLGNIFEVSIDYLLKDTVDQNPNNENGYYVSKEMAEGYLQSQNKVSKYLALGFCLLIFSTIPYFLFREDPITFTLLTIVIAVIGIGTLTAAIMKEDRYSLLKKEMLIFDQHALKDLKMRYEAIKKKYTAVMMIGICSIVGGAIFFLIIKKEWIDVDIITPYKPIFIALIGIGVYIMVRTLSIIDAYRILVKNEEHVNTLNNSLMKKVKKKINDL